MFEEPDKKTLNHKFWKVRDGWKSRPATKKELTDARKDFKAGIKSGKYKLMSLGRSCWVCNACHTHLIDMPAMNCFACGRIYHKGIDIIDYKGSEFEKYVSKPTTVSNKETKE